VRSQHPNETENGARGKRCDMDGKPGGCFRGKKTSYATAIVENNTAGVRDRQGGNRTREAGNRDEVESVVAKLSFATHSSNESGKTILPFLSNPKVTPDEPPCPSEANPV
jgi:hypothetical protein